MARTVRERASLDDGTEGEPAEEPLLKAGQGRLADEPPPTECLRPQRVRQEEQHLGDSDDK